MADKLYLIKDDSASGARATEIWQTACQALALELEVLERDSPTARSLCKSLDLHSFPALLRGDRVLAVGTPDPGSARQILARAEPI